MRTLTALLFALVAPLLSAQETPLITEEYDRFTQKTILKYTPDMPRESPRAHLFHELGTEVAVLSYTHIRRDTELRHGCDTQGLADGKPFKFPVDGQYKVEVLRHQGYFEMVSWGVSMDLLRQFAAANSVEIRHCGVELYILPGITEAARQMLIAIERNKAD